MRNISSVLLAASITLTGTATAQETSSYAQIHGGLFVVTDDALDTNAVLPGSENYDVAAYIDYEPGIAIGALYGHRLSARFALEAEVTYRTTKANGVGLIFDGEDIGESSKIDLDGSLDTFAFMANGVYTLPILGRFEPFVGGGVGYIMPDTADDVDADGLIGYQAKVGVAVPIGSNSFGIEAAYLGTGGFDESDGDTEVTVGYGGVSVLAAYRFGF
ncbi:outer membrane protein [Parvularcula dongshanensis]|uniref:Opacity protein-like surface antigen n=1 Tax=Parvularcula dongshanensis TaxID=1173995 RepID=A0A840I495_9PROT|nr:outer membrane beta-barrel protein [Parvularcula dongshanensis]MBB4659162.1 opacity protein-like surface antigen [Parvularcula dongshanensis]